MTIEWGLKKFDDLTPLELYKIIQYQIYLQTKLAPIDKSETTNNDDNDSSDTSENDKHIEDDDDSDSMDKDDTDT